MNGIYLYFVKEHLSSWPLFGTLIHSMDYSTFLQVSFVLASLQSGSRGTQACINAAHTVSGIIADLDTTIMFATAGTLNADGEDSFADHRLVYKLPDLPVFRLFQFNSK